jgi:hypothetical protein
VFTRALIARSRWRRFGLSRHVANLKRTQELIPRPDAHEVEAAVRVALAVDLISRTVATLDNRHPRPLQA